MTETKSDPKNGARLAECTVIIEKGRTTDVRVGLSEYKGRVYLDIRTYVVGDATGDRKPTRKGITLPLDKIPELRVALAALHREAIDLGLLEDDIPEPVEAAAA